MTEQNRRHAIEQELRRARDALAASQLYADAVSRLSYYILGHVRALLLTDDLEPRSHEAALRLFSLHFIKPGIIEREMAYVFSRMMKYREEADYNAAYSFSGEEFADLRRDGTKLAAACSARARGDARSAGA